MSPYQRHRGLAVALVCLVTIVAFETMSVATIMPIIRDDLGGLGLYGWAFSGLALGEIVGIVIAGRWSDRANLAHPLVAALVVYCVGLAVSGAAHSMLLVVIGRVLQGVGAGAVPTVTYTCVGRAFATEERGRIFAVLSSAWIVPSMVGPVLAGFIAERAGWRWVFLGLIPVVVLIGAMAIAPVASVPTVRSDDERDTARVGPALLLTLGTAMAFAGFQASEPLVSVAAAIVGVAIGVPAFRALTPRGTLRARRGIPAAVATRGLLTFAFFGSDAFVTLSLTSVRHTSPTFAGAALASAAFTWSVGSWIQAREVLRIGPRVLVRWGFGLVALGVGLIAVTTSSAVPIGMAVVAWSVAGMGMGLGYAPLAQAVLAASPLASQGRVTASLQLSDTLGMALGTGLGGVFVAIAHRWGRTVEAGVSMMWLTSIVVACVGFVAARGVAGPREMDADHAIG